MARIISIGTAVPPFAHKQKEILDFMRHFYGLGGKDIKSLQLLYRKSGINNRYSVLSDYSLPKNGWTFYPCCDDRGGFPSLEQRMECYYKFSGPLSVEAIQSCLANVCRPEEITHLITVSCTGMSAPGLDVELVELMGFAKTICRTSVNFMGCYAAIHALKIANAFCSNEPGARVLVVCTELCTLHFQREPTISNIVSSLLFADGSAAALVVGDGVGGKGIHLDGFYAEVLERGRKEMAWELSSTGFQMSLSSYVPDLIEADLRSTVERALQKTHVAKDEITHWCAHPGGRKILEAICNSLELNNDELADSMDILMEHGNMSSPTILFVLRRMMSTIDYRRPNNIFGMAFGPGLTIETFIGST